MFRSEYEMSYYFRQYLTSDLRLDFPPLPEYEGLFGIPDFLLLESEISKDDPAFYVIAVELKLKNWKRALDQAFRYLNFANKSFVILDDMYIHRALRNVKEFEYSNIGLASFSVLSGMHIHFSPKDDTPFCKSTTKVLQNRLIDLHPLHYDYSDNRKTISQVF